MHTGARRIVSMLLAVCLLMAMLPNILPKAEALTLGYTPSSAYQSSSFYSAVLDVTLTGDQREDIINVALSQVGYVEGSSSGDFGGAKDGSYVNYTEYNYWYHNHVSSGMPVGGSYAHWCATFVSWCAEQAGVPTSILKRSTAAGHSYSYFNLNFYSGSSTLASSSDNDSYFMGYNYSPKKGDLFFTRSWSHVGLVVSSDGTYVTTVEGNTNNDGSADGYGVFVRTRRIADLYFGAPEYEDNSYKDYASSSCTYYPAHCKITIDSATPINSQPRSVSTEDDSVTIGDAVAGQTYSATALYCNSFGNYWYRVDTGTDEIGYVYSGDASYVEQITSDITLTGYSAPSAHVSGNSFGISGTVSSKYNKLNTAACYIYSGFGVNGEAVTGASDSVSGNKYVLGGSNVDYGTAFGVLENGKHTYVISASYTNYYATNSTTIASNTGTVCLLSEYFVVIPSSVSQSSCSHSYSTTTIQSATCTQSGTAVKACSKCGLVSETTVAASGHSYGGWVTVDATCTTAGSKSRTCTTCGNVETQSISAGGHDYSVVTHAATCRSYAVYEYTCGNCGDHYCLNAGEMASDWMDYLPAGLDSSLFNSKTQYRYSDYQTATSYETSLSGYTLKSSAWEKAGTKTVYYVNSWPSGFSTSSSLYTEYNNKSGKVSASESATSKTTVDSDEVAGYLYYHWCYTDSYYSVASSSGSYTTFHAYYSTTNPDSYTCDPSDYSYCTAHSSCSNSDWFFVTEVYAQESTSYNKLFTYERWTDYSDWSDTVATANDTRRVES